MKWINGLVIFVYYNLFKKQEITKVVDWNARNRFSNKGKKM